MGSSASFGSKRGRLERRVRAVLAMGLFATAPAAHGFTSDEFDDPATQGLWTTYSPELAELQDIDASVPGSLALAPAASSVFGSLQAPFVYQEVFDAIAIEARVRLRQALDPTLPLASGVAYASIVIADAALVDGTETFVELGLGLQDGGAVVRSIATLNATPEVVTAPAPALEADLLLCRVGSTFRSYVRFDDGLGWQLLKEWVKPCPTHVMCGMAATDPSGLADPLAVFDYFRFGVPADLDACTTSTLPPVGVPSRTPASLLALIAGLAGASLLWLARSEAGWLG